MKRIRKNKNCRLTREEFDSFINIARIQGAQHTDHPYFNINNAVELQASAQQSLSQKQNRATNSADSAEQKISRGETTGCGQIVFSGQVVYAGGGGIRRVK